RRISLKLSRLPCRSPATRTSAASVRWMTRPRRPGVLRKASIARRRVVSSRPTSGMGSTRNPWATSLSYSTIVVRGSTVRECRLRLEAFMAGTDLVVAFTGASGTPYGMRLLEVLLRAGRTVHLTLSPAAVEVIEQELDRVVTVSRFAARDLIGPVADELPL